MEFSMAASQPDVRQEALVSLTAQFVKQGHPLSYAQHMATASIFQADLELRNAQFTRLIAWLKETHVEIYPEALALAEDMRQEFEKRVTGEF